MRLIETDVAEAQRVFHRRLESLPNVHSACWADPAFLPCVRKLAERRETHSDIAKWIYWSYQAAWQREYRELAQQLVGENGITAEDECIRELGRTGLVVDPTLTWERHIREENSRF